jgi:hypothetical protein
MKPMRPEGPAKKEARAFGLLWPFLISKQPMSKHKQRRERRSKYRERLRTELADERAIIRRVIRSMNHNGLDVAPDGRPIKADFFGAIREWEKTDQQSSRACLSLVEKAVRQVQVKPVVNR